MLEKHNLEFIKSKTYTLFTQMLIWFLSVTKSLTIDVILYDLASSQHIFSNILHILKNDWSLILQF